MKLKHKISLLVIGILLVVSLLISSSYALWVFNVSQESTNVLVSDCFEITFTDNNPIGLGASFPMRDSDGVQTTPYTFTIKNICNHPADFQINLETLSSSTIDESFIKADLNGHITEYNTADSVEPTIDTAKSAVMLYEDTLAVNVEKTYNLRLWVNEIATQEDVENKSYASKISVKATVRKQFAEGTLIRGDDFNVALKKLADGGNPYYYTNNTSITSIEWSNTVPQESDNAINIAEEGTITPIYAWFKDGVINIYSTLDKIYMNSYSAYIFYGMQGITSIDLSHVDTSNVTYMHGMFYGMSSLTNLDVSHFDTSKVTNMSSMFSKMNSLTSLDVSNFDTSNVTDMHDMFDRMSSLTNLDVRHFDTSKVTNMSSMFSGMSSLTSLDVSHFDTSNVESMYSMFYGMSNLTNLDVSHFITSNVTSMSQMFSGMSNLTNLDVSHFDTSNVTNMSHMFSKMSGLTNLDLSNFDTSKVTNMSGMFREMSGLTTLDLNNFDTSNVTDMYSMFYKMSNLTNLDVSNFDTSKVTSMGWMFCDTRKLSTLDLSNFDTSKVTNMSYMFYTGNANEGMGLTSIKGIETFNTSNVTDMSHIFGGCTRITNLELKWNTSNVTNMEGMFEYMLNIQALDISTFDTSNVTNMSKTFYHLENVTTIYVGQLWNTSKIDLTSKLFYMNYKLVGSQGTAYAYPNTSAEYARVDDPANGKPGYFTLKTN